MARSLPPHGPYLLDDIISASFFFYAIDPFLSIYIHSIIHSIAAHVGISHQLKYREPVRVSVVGCVGVVPVLSKKKKKKKADQAEGCSGDIGDSTKALA